LCNLGGLFIRSGREKFKGSWSEIEQRLLDFCADLTILHSLTPTIVQMNLLQVLALPRPFLRADQM